MRELLTTFHRTGYTHLRSLVPASRIRDARALIRDSLEKDESHGQMLLSLQSTFCRELESHPTLLSLIEPAASTIAALLGLPRAPTTSSVQIALRFPVVEARDEERFGFHVDGFPSEGNGVARGTVERQTLLVGVYLTPTRGPDRGNFVVWPGSHRKLAKHLRDMDALAFLRRRGAEALLARIRAFECGPPKQLEVEPGDVVIAHHLLCHGAADNLSLRTREAIYFRLLHPDDDTHDPSPLVDARRFFAPA
jgi:hypothetical protein